MSGNSKVSGVVTALLFAVAANAWAQHRARAAAHADPAPRACAAVITDEEVELRFEMIPARAETPTLRELLAAGGARSRTVSFEWNAATGEIDYSPTIRRYVPPAGAPSAEQPREPLQRCGD